MTNAVLEVRDLNVRFALERGLLRRKSGDLLAVAKASFELARGEVLALVGGSGAGKSTLGRAVLRLVEPARGSVRYHRDGAAPIELLALEARAMRALRRELAIVFQDPASSLDPRRSVAEIVGEGLVVHGIATGAELAMRVARELERVRLPQDTAARYPHELSGGERQRVAIARSLALAPRVLVCDEIASALDVAVQREIAAILRSEARERGLACLFIAHDLRLVREVASRVLVMHKGEIVERGAVDSVLERPEHPATRALVAAVPALDAAEREARARATAPR